MNWIWETIKKAVMIFIETTKQVLKDMFTIFIAWLYAAFVLTILAALVIGLYKYLY